MNESSCDILIASSTTKTNMTRFENSDEQFVLTVKGASWYKRYVVVTETND